MRTVARQIVIVACAYALSLGLAQDSGAYEEISLPESGSLSGTVNLDGKVPMPKGYNLTTVPDPVYCGRISDGRGWRLLQPFDVGPKGEFRSVVVYLDGIDKGKPFGEYMPPRIEAVDCRFMPFIALVRDLHDVVVVNMDPAFHDIQAYETSNLGPRVLFNVPLPISKRYPREAGLSAHFHKHYEGTTVTQRVKMTKSRKIFSMQCGFHPYMESWALVTDHPYYALADNEGRFQLTGIPPGTYRVKVWHPYIRDDIEQTITIEPNEQTTVALKVEAPSGRLYANQMVENAYVRYTITEDVQSQIVPTLEKQRIDEGQ
ncbi:MAG: carboxypeptidase regulatory-like domain-containing protein [Nitrospira sp.]|nr:carboxypeptidase regulatory-like domain-containing protein [Nitrospira sp.]